MSKKNQVVVFVLMSLSAVAVHAADPAPLPHEIRCLEAGGYYGNIHLLQGANGQIQVNAAQGFAYEISQELRAPKGHEASNLLMAFAPGQCHGLTSSGTGGLRCAGPVDVRAQGFTGSDNTQFAAVALLSVVPGMHGTAVTLDLQIPNSSRSGTASFTFAVSGLGQGCVIR